MINLFILLAGSAITLWSLLGIFVFFYNCPNVNEIKTCPKVIAYGFLHGIIIGVVLIIIVIGNIILNCIAAIVNRIIKWIFS